MNPYSLIVGVRALVLIPFSILALGSVATILIFLGAGERYINGPLARYWARFVLRLAAARVTVYGPGNISS
ncbi:MAG: hypothetical protein RRA15_12555, partial [bacterium]|nr:hypothetical protein [bacterium]